jgi:hypothetical protein
VNIAGLLPPVVHDHPTPADGRHLLGLGEILGDHQDRSIARLHTETPRTRRLDFERAPSRTSVPGSSTMVVSTLAVCLPATGVSP